MPVPPRPHCLGAGAEGREAQGERREVPAAPAPAASADGPAMAPAPRLALLAAALLCTPGKWEQHREWHRERQLAPGTGTDPTPLRTPPAVLPGSAPAYSRNPDRILPFPTFKVPPFRRDPGSRGDLTPSSFFPAFPGICVPHSAGIRIASIAGDPEGVTRGTWDPLGSREGNLLPIPTGNRRPRDSPSPRIPGSASPFPVHLIALVGSIPGREEAWPGHPGGICSL